MASLRRDYLSALGIEPLVLRAAAPDAPQAPLAAPQAAVADRASSVATAANVRLRLQVRSTEPEPLAGAHADLLRGMLRALNVEPAEVSFELHEALPSLAFGADAGAAGVRAPALAALRDAHAKRALWPVLRRLRRQLRGMQP